MNSGLVVSVPASRLPVLGSYLGQGPLNSAVLEAAGCKKNSHGSGIIPYCMCRTFILAKGLLCQLI